jgi:hypothetical protein
VITKKVSGASGATLETQKWLKLQTLFCAASYNIKERISSLPKKILGGLSHPTFNHPCGVDGKKD